MSHYTFSSSPSKPKKIDQIPKYSHKEQSPLKNLLNLEKRPSELTLHSQQLRLLKLQAIEKERLMLKKRKSAIKIQKVVRGWLKRRVYLRYKEEKYIDDCLQYMRNRKLNRIKANAVSIITTALYSYITRRRDEKKDLYSKFINHCATLIQSHFRVYIKEKRRGQQIKKKAKFISCLWALILGWKTRKILRLPLIINLKQQILEVDKLGDDILNSSENLRESVSNKYIQRDLSKGKRKLKLELISFIERFIYEQNWVQQMYIKIKSSNKKKSHTPQKSLDVSSTFIPEELTSKFNQIKINQPKSVNLFEVRETTPIGGGFNSVTNSYEEEIRVAEDNTKPKFKFLRRNSQKNQRKEKDVKENDEGNEETQNVPEVWKEKTEEALDDLKEEESQPKFQFLKRKKNKIVNEKLDWNSKINSKISCWGVKESPSKKVRAVSSKKNERSVDNNDIIMDKTQTQPNAKSLKTIELDIEDEDRKEDRKEKRNVSLEELEKAFHNNYLLKFASFYTKKINIQKSLESLKLDQLKRNSTVPELNSNSKFIRGYRDKFFMNAMRNLEEHYKNLQAI